MPDRTRYRSGRTPEFEIEYYTKELGQSLQRELLQKQFARLSDSGNGSITGSHEDQVAPPSGPVPPADEPAG